MALDGRERMTVVVATLILQRAQPFVIDERASDGITAPSS
jgi:hypothetical protein